MSFISRSLLMAVCGVGLTISMTSQAEAGFRHRHRGGCGGGYYGQASCCGDTYSAPMVSNGCCDSSGYSGGYGGPGYGGPAYSGPSYGGAGYGANGNGGANYSGSGNNMNSRNTTSSQTGPTMAPSGQNPAGMNPGTSVPPPLAAGNRGSL